MLTRIAWLTVCLLLSLGAAFASWSWLRGQDAVGSRRPTLTIASPAPAADNPQVRHTTLPSTVVNRLAAAGLLVLAISELPAPEKDLLDPSEQLCNYIRRQQRPDGSLCYGDDSPDTEGRQAGLDTDG